MEEGATPRGVRIIEYMRRRTFAFELLTFFAALLAGRICLKGTMSPFGLAFIAAAAMSGCNVHFAAVGAIVGSLFLSGQLRIEPASASALFYGLHLFWNKLRPRAESHERLFLMCISFLVLIPVFHADGVAGLQAGLMAGGICVFGALVMQNALRTLRQLSRRHVLTDAEQISISAFFGILLLSVTDVVAFGFSLPVVLLLCFSMIAALARGMAGVAVSVALAAVLTLGGEFTLMFAGSLAACTLAGASLRKMESLGVLGGFVACSLLVGTYVFTAPHTINLINLALAGAAFLVIPREKMLALCAYFDGEKNRERYAKKAMRRIRERTAADMRHMSNVCREVAGLFKPKKMEKEPSDALMQWTAQAAYGVCADCPMRVLCWQDSQAAAESVYAMLQSHERGERLRIKKPFDPSCKHMPQMAAAAWQAQNQYLVQRAMQEQTAQQYSFINRQLIGICDVIEQLSHRVEEDCWLDEELEHILLRGLDKRNVRALSVDATYPNGRLQVCLRLPPSYLTDTGKVLEYVNAVLKRRMRLLATHTDGRTCILIMEEAAELAATFGTAGMPIQKNGISGDSTGERRLENGRVLYALSDGMGAGETAKLESESAIRMLFDLYSIGLNRDVALASVNKLLLERRADMYATLDAVSIDLSSGTAEFIKYGAPPTFIARGSKVHEVHAEALPAGILPEAIPAISTATLRKDDTVVLFSDGVLDALGSETKSVISEAVSAKLDCRELARSILERAQSMGQEDDMTVMVIRIA